MIIPLFQYIWLVTMEMGYRSAEIGIDARYGEADVSVAFLLSPDFTLLPFAGFIDAMRHAADEADRSIVAGPVCRRPGIQFGRAVAWRLCLGGRCKTWSNTTT